MKILILTALFPPDVAPPAPFVKELATRLSPRHTVSILTYGNIPETVTGVTITTVSKAELAPLRLTRFMRSLLTHARQADVVIVNNAPSTELPALLISLVTPPRWFLVHSDVKIVYRSWRRMLHSMVGRRLIPIEIALPPGRPELLPFAPTPTSELAAYEQGWAEFVTSLEQAIKS